MKLGSSRRINLSTCHCDGNMQYASPRDNRRVVNIVKAKDKVLIILDDCTYLEAPFDVVDISVKQLSSDDITAIKNDVRNEVMSSVLAELSPIETVGGDRLADAFNVNQ